MNQLRIRYDNGEVISIPLEGDGLVLGRAPEADLVCPADEALSRRHCRFYPAGDDWTVEDLGSRNGTLVNGVRLTGTAVLHPGDVIVAGHLVFSCTPAGASDSPAVHEAIAEEPTWIGQPAAPRSEVVPVSGRGRALPAEVGAGGLASLMVLTGSLAGTRYLLSKDFTIGRALESDLILPDRYVSRRHARIVYEAKRFVLYSTGVNGTAVNGNAIRERHELRDGQEVRIADFSFRFRQTINPADVTPAGKKRLRDFERVWHDLRQAASTESRPSFVAAADRLVSDLLCDALGMIKEEFIPYYAGTVGYMVEAPGWRIRKPHFPVLVAIYADSGSDLSAAFELQLAQAKARDYFALLIVIPAKDTVLDEADQVRKRMVGRLARHDLVILDHEHLAQLVALGSSEHLIRIVLDQGIDISVLSPYIVAGAVSGNMFFGREKEVKDIKQTIQTGNYAVVGGRRIGKSSIVQKVTRLLNDDPARYEARHLNCEHIFTYADVFEAFGDAFEKPGGVSDATSFRRLLIDRAKKIQPRNLVMLLDEVDTILDFDARPENQARLFKIFRSLSHDGICRFVFSGSRVLYQHLRNPGSPFFNFCEHMVLKPLDQESIAEIVSKPLSQLGIALEDETAVIGWIIDVTSCHPNLAQWICDRLLKTISEQRITFADVQAITGSREFHEHFVQTAWGDAEPLEKLLSLLSEGPEFELDAVLAKAAGYGIRSRAAIQQALEMLQLRALIQRDGRRYRFQLTHFPRIAREYEELGFQLETFAAQIQRDAP